MELKELMTKNVITVLQSMNVRDAAEMLFNMGISGLPVVNDQKNLVGMITEKDIIGMALPKYVEKLGSLAYTFDMVPFAKTLAEADKVLVKEIMRKDVITATVDTSVPGWSALSPGTTLLRRYSKRRMLSNLPGLSEL
jgi:CBS domain-containing protein